MNKCRAIVQHSSNSAWFGVVQHDKSPQIWTISSGTTSRNKGCLLDFKHCGTLTHVTWDAPHNTMRPRES